MRPFAYARAQSASAALATFAATPRAMYLAGGTTLIDLIKIDVESPAAVIDINALGLAEISTDASGEIRIGALARMSDTADNAAIRSNAPAVAQALEQSASAQLRNMASIGGNLLQRTRCEYFRDVSQPCNKRAPGSGCSAIGGDDRKMAILGANDRCIAVNPSDFSTAMLITDATLHLSGSAGERRVPLLGFHRLPDDPSRDTNLAPGELITGISFMPSALTRNSTYVKVRDRASYEFALISVAAGLDIQGGVIRDARIALGSVAHAPWRARAAEAALIGKVPNRSAFEAAAVAELSAAVPQRLNRFKVTMTKNAMLRALATVGGAA